MSSFHFKRFCKDCVKTVLIQEIINLLNQEDRNFSIMALRGRAARVVCQKVKCDAQTIHRSIYSYQETQDTKKNDNEDSFRYVAKIKDNEDDSRHIYIIDEASMIFSNKFSDSDSLFFGTGHLLDDVLSYVDLPSMPNRKIIFIGDPSQLPPVNTNFSEALSFDYFKNNNISLMDSYMKTWLFGRKKEGQFLKNAVAIRNEIELGHYQSFSLSDEDKFKSLNLNKDFIEKYIETARPKEQIYSLDSPIIITSSKPESS